MLNEKTINELKLNKIKGLYANEFIYWKQGKLANEAYRVDINRSAGADKEEIALRIRNALQTMLPQKTWHIQKTYEHVSELLHTVYTWL